MKKKTVRNVLAFFLVFILTVTAVAGLSIITSAATSREAAIEQIKEDYRLAEEAAIIQMENQSQIEPSHSIGGFAVVIIVLGVLYLIYRKKITAESCVVKY